MVNKFGTLLFSSIEFQNEFDKLFVDNTHSTIKIDVPDTFDGRQVWKDLLINSPNQYNCVSCWVFASLYVLSARLSIYTNGKYKYTFSPSKMLFTAKTTWEKIKKDLDSGIPFDYTTPEKTIVVNSCSIGSLLDAWQFLYSIGVPETSCVDDASKIDNVYSANQLFGNTYDVCPGNQDEMISHRIGGYYFVSGTKSKNRNIKEGKEVNIRRDIYHWGPCTSAMKIFEDFLKWDGKGVYVWDQISERAGDNVGHAVIIMGWGVENDIPYWLVLNTWGSYWGDDNGYFKIIRGQNHCEIEENVVVGYPMLPAFTLFVEQPILFKPEDLAIRAVYGIQDNGYKLTSYEKILMNKKHNVDSSLVEYIYKDEYWPDFSQFVAGDLSKRIYHLQTKKKSVVEKYEEEEDCNLEYWLNIIIIVLSLAIGLKYINKK